MGAGERITESVCWDLLNGMLAVSAQRIAFTRDVGSDAESAEWLNQQEKNVNAMLKIAFSIDLEACPEFQGDIDIIKHCGFSYSHELSKFRLRKFAKSEYTKYLGALAGLHNEMARHCRRVYAHFCPVGLPGFEIAFRSALNGE
jgi:hypothetical protein